MKKLFYLFALCSMVMLTACDSDELTPYGDKTKLWFAGVDGSEYVGGFINQDGKMVIPAKYYLSYYDIYNSSWAYFPRFSCGWAYAYDMDAEQNVFIDKDGKVGREMSDYYYCDEFYNNYAQVANEKDYYGLIDKDLKEVIPTEYWYLGSASAEGLCYFHPSLDEPYGYINTKGEVVIEPEFYDAWGFYDGIATVKVKEGDEIKYSVIDPKGNYVIEPQKKPIYNGGRGLLIFMASNGKWGLLDKKGNEVLAATYDDIWGFYYTDLSGVIKNGKYGFINTKGELVINATYDLVWDFYDDYTWVYKSGKHEAINKKGETLFKLKEAEYPVSYFHNGLALIANSDNYTLRYVDKEGKTVYKWTFEPTSPTAPQRRTAPLTQAEQDELRLRAAKGTPYYSLVEERLGRSKKK